MVGCPNDDTTTTTEARPYLDVYNEDIAEIEDFMDTHFITVDGDYNVTFTEITGTTPGTPISDHPALNFKTISKGGVDHKLYYLKLNEGVGSNPTKLDSVFSSYKGYKTDLSVFDTASNPIWFQLEDVIDGWQEIFPEFKSGTSFTDSDTNVTTYSDFGAGVMFVPSGLAYFNTSTTSIGSYTPIIFSFKLMKLKYNDQDGDKILSKDEYGGPITATSTALDSDGDGKPDYADFDDDNDGKYTKNELSDALPVITKTNGYFDFNDIPDCNGVRPAVGKRKHLNAACY